MKENTNALVIKAFWELVRSGLHEEIPDRSLFVSFGHKEWNLLLEEVKKQTVVGICFASLQRLPKDNHPPREMYLEWYREVFLISQHHQRLRTAWAKLSEIYEQSNIYPVLMKGLGVAMCYPDPTLRMTGDIDLFIPDQYKKSVKLVESWGLDVHYSKEHDKFSYYGLSVELHDELIHLPSRLTETNDWTDISYISVQDQELTYRLPDYDSQAILLVTHPFKHLYSWGIGVRHLCDWAMFLQTNHTYLDQKKLRSFFKRAYMERFVSAFTALAVNFLGLPEEIGAPWMAIRYEKAEKKLLQDIQERGDIGIEAFRIKHNLKGASFSVGFIVRWLRFYSQDVLRVLWLNPIAPAYTPRRFLSRAYAVFRSMLGKDRLIDE